jgi:hypothetical protein
MSFMAKAGIGPAINKGHIYTMVVALLTGLGAGIDHHFNPSMAEKQAVETSSNAVDKAADAAAKAAVLETKVTEHTAELGQVIVSVSDMKMDVAVLKSQGAEAKIAANKLDGKVDQILEAVYRMQGQQARNYPSASSPSR